MSEIFDPLVRIEDKELMEELLAGKYEIVSCASHSIKGLECCFCHFLDDRPVMFICGPYSLCKEHAAYIREVRDGSIQKIKK